MSVTTPVVSTSLNLHPHHILRSRPAFWLAKLATFLFVFVLSIYQRVGPSPSFRNRFRIVVWLEWIVVKWCYLWWVFWIHWIAKKLVFSRLMKTRLLWGPIPPVLMFLDRKIFRSTVSYYATVAFSEIHDVVTHIEVHVGAKATEVFFGTKVDDGAVNQKEEDPSPKTSPSDVTIIFGSQTGTAEMYATELFQESRRMGVKRPIFIDVEEYQPYTRLLDEKFVIFVLATYGEGEPTDSAKGFYDWLMEKDRQDLNGQQFDNLSFTVFGLGDSQYKHFNQMAVDIDKRMKALGAKCVHPLGLGDNAAGSSSLEEGFDQWRTAMWPTIGIHFDLKLKLDTTEELQPSALVLKFLDDDADHRGAPFPSVSLPSSLDVRFTAPQQKTPAWLKIQCNSELLMQQGSSIGRSTRKIILDLSSHSSVSYQAGDHLGILPCNPDALVNAYLQRLEVAKAESERVIALVNSAERNVLPGKVKMETVFKWYVDLHGAPKKATLRTLAHYCTDSKEREQFLSMLRVHEESQRIFRKTVTKKGGSRTVLDFLNLFPSCQVPIGHFLEVMPRISPRYFSISSDQLLTPEELGITMTVVPGGLCTTMLQSMHVGDAIPCFVRKSTFRLPLRAKSRPLILIGPGTGVAPLIGFSCRREAWKAKGQELGECLFFFGCRRQDEDFIYKTELERWRKSGVITDLQLAFSRTTVRHGDDDKEQHRKHYVQHDIAKCSAKIWALLSSPAGANIYMCGDAKHMAKDVECALRRDVVMKEGGMHSEKKAAEFLEKLEKSGRFLKDVWSA